ncbi:MAG: hypothetical protein ACK4N5_11325 [Myxococcales bacterium]
MSDVFDNPAAQLAALNKAADALVREVERVYRDGCQRIGFTTQQVAQLLAGSTVTTSGWLTSSQQAAAEKAMKDLAPLVVKWRGTYRTWARNGKRDDGSSYTWKRWAEHGEKDLLSAVRTYTSAHYDGSSVRAVLKAAEATVADTAAVVKTVANPLKWPWWVKAGVSLGLGIVVVAVAAPYVKAARAVAKGG